MASGRGRAGSRSMRAGGIFPFSSPGRPALGELGISLLELVVAMAIIVVITTLAGLSAVRYVERSTAKGAAQLFAQDLRAARGLAVRSQETVVLHFDEDGRWYRVERASTSEEILRRRFSGRGTDSELTLMTLDVTGDSLVFDARGLLKLSGAEAATARASFSSGASTYTVSFNGMGASKIDRT